METKTFDIADIYKCNHCGKLIEYPQHAVDFRFFDNEELMSKDDLYSYCVALDSSEPYNKLRFRQNYIAPCLCNECDKELKEYLADFVQAVEE